MKIDRGVANRGLEVIAKPPPLLLGANKAGFANPQEKVLENLFHVMRIPNQSAKVFADGPLVTDNKLSGVADY